MTTAKIQRRRLLDPPADSVVPVEALAYGQLLWPAFSSPDMGDGSAGCSPPMPAQGGASDLGAWISLLVSWLHAAVGIDRQAPDMSKMGGVYYAYKFHA